MDPHPPFDHQHYRRAHPGHHYPDQHRHYADQHLAGGMGGSAAPARSRYDYDSHPIQYFPPDQQHHLPRIHHLPPTAASACRCRLPPPLHRHDAPHYAPLPLRAPPETYSPPPYRSLSPHHHYHPQRHGGDDFRAPDEIRRVPSRHHQHHHMPEHHHHHHQPQLPWEAVEAERRHYAPLQLPSDSRKRHRCALHDSGDLESTSSSGPAPRRQRHTSYSSDDDFVDRTASHPSYSRHEAFGMHSDSKGNRKMQTSAPTMLPDSPRKIDPGYPRCASQKSAPARVSVWQRIEENPSLYTPSSPRKLAKEVHISPSKTKNVGCAPKELASVISLDCKAVSPSKSKSNGSASKESANVISLDHKAKNVDCKNSGDNGGTKKSTGKKSEKVLASVLVKPSPESKEKQMPVKQATRKPDKIQNNVPEQKDIVDASANGCEKEEGEITTSSYEKDDNSALNLISTSDTGVSSVVAEKEQNDCLLNPCKSNAASAIASVGILDTERVSGSQHHEKEDGEIVMDPGDINATLVVDSMKALDTIGSEHPGDRVCMDFGGQNSAVLDGNDDSHMEKDGMAIPGAINVVVACNSPRMSDTMKLHEFDVLKAMTGNNTACVNGVNGDTNEVWESINIRRENSNVLLGSNGEGDLFTNNLFRSPSTAEASVTAGKDVHRKKGSEMCIASLGDTVETSKISESSMTEDTHKEEGNMLPSPRDKGRVSVSSQGALNSMELSVNEEIQDKDGRISTEPSKANASITHHSNARDGLEASASEDVQDKECITSIELHDAATSVANHEKAPNIMEFSMDENIQKKESQMSIDSNALKTTQRKEAHYKAEAFTNRIVGSEVCRSHIDSDETHVDALDNSVDAPHFVLAGAPEDIHTQELLHDQRIALDKSNLHWEAVDVESSNFPLANNDVGKDTISQAAETIHIRKADLSCANNLSLLQSHDSPSLSDNSDHSLPTALTLGNNTYFSSAESEQPEENHKLMELSKVLDDVTTMEFGKIENGNSESGDDLIKADAQNWLTLPLSVNYLNDDATVSTDKFDLEQNVDEGTSVSQDHAIMPDMDQYGNIDAFNGQDRSLKLSCSDMSQSDLLVLKERNKNIENESEIVPPESSVCSVNVLDQHGYRTIDKPINITNKPITLSSQSAAVTGKELTSSRALDPGRTYHSSTMDPVVESSTKPDLLSSWMGAILSEAAEEHQQSKSTPDTTFGPKEDTRKTLPDLLSKFCIKISSQDKCCKLNSSKGLPPKLPLKKNGKTQNCYIRKGNALIRNPATGNHPQSSSCLDAPSKLSKPIMRRSMNFVRKVDSNDAVAHPNISVERPKTPPLPLHARSITTNISEPFPQPLQKQQVPETEKKDSSGQANLGVDNPGVSSRQKSEPLDAGKMVYVRPKSNKLVASQGQQSCDSISGSTDKAENSNTGETKVLMCASSNKNLTVSKDRPHKALQTINTVGSFSHVWTLSGQHPQRKPFVGMTQVKAFPRILPWKRKVFSHNYTSSLGIVSIIHRKLLKTRKRGTIYTVSTNGFSLRKSGLLSFDGSSLKWSRSLEKGSQKVNEEATLAVAEIDRKKRERRKSLRNKGRNDQYAIAVASRNNHHTSSDSRMPSTCNEYAFLYMCASTKATNWSFQKECQIVPIFCEQCRKKHSYVCPVFEATGECPQQSRCKLHHPKKKTKSKRSRVDTLQNNNWGRYFDSSIGEGSEVMRVCSEEEDKQKLEHANAGDLADFIDLGPDIDGSIDVNASDGIHLMELDSRNLKMQADNLDALIKPLRIMRKIRV
ncbi:hypothetical protein PR202_gb27983 [Eleusine coracana subsp. coracana]|uniref:C3H1-type domain-containing protein n=1 Tax=Eleusine coracana subsp. coracana TaxID=191504 RepID=A0AAV5FVW3_ELECO|nr:hypothetical protein PR202_gb27983 [Eleusine coracana subsp. coracana]